MKRILSILILGFMTGICIKVFPQDKFITSNNDTIECEIVRIYGNYIFFEVDTGGIISSRKLPIGEIKDYSISVTRSDNEEKIIRPESFKRMLIGAGAGPSYLIASSANAEQTLIGMGVAPHQAKSYYKDLKTSLVANASIGILFTPDYGAGLTYKFHYTSASFEGFFDPQDNVSLIYSTYGERIFVNYIGASFISRRKIGSWKSFNLCSEASLGMATYRNEMEYLNSYLLLTGKSIGMDAVLRLEYLITKNISGCADLSVFYSSVRKLKITDGTTTSAIELEKENYENISRIELSFGIRYYFLSQ